MAACSSAWAIDLNQASRADIESVRGIGVEMAERIVVARGQAAFVDWRDVSQRVKGLGPHALQGMAEAGFLLAGKPPSIAQAKRPLGLGPRRDPREPRDPLEPSN